MNDGFRRDDFDTQNGITPEGEDTAVNFVMKETEAERENTVKQMQDEQGTDFRQTAYQPEHATETPVQESAESKMNTEETVNKAEGSAAENSSQRRGVYQLGADYPPVTNVDPRTKNTNKKAKNIGGLAWKKVVAFIGAAAVFGVVAGAGFQAVNYVGNKTLGTTNKNVVVPQVSTSDSSKSTKTLSTDNSGDLSAVVKKVMPSVVSITSIGEQTVQNMFGFQQNQESQSSGSGIILGQNDTELLIATNNHVVSGSNTLYVYFNDNKDDDAKVEAKIKGTDASKDLAVISVEKGKIKEDVLNTISIATLGDSKDISVGETAIAIGNALGYGQSVTRGIISAVDREVTIEEVTNKLIQTDAAINPGNSGGALINAAGEVIGINSVKFASNEVEGMGYAIPISEATPILNELMTKETRDKVDSAEAGYLGIKGLDVSADARAYNLPAGVYVSEAVKGDAADKAGMKTGDIITKFDGTTIDSMTTLQKTLQYYKAGEEVKVVVKRVSKNGEYKDMELKIKLSKKSEE